MYKKRYILFIILMMSWIQSNGQNYMQKQKNLEESFANLSDSLNFNLKYINDKATLYLSVFKNKAQKKGYRFLVKDIHPEGIFLIGNEIRILSINNGHVFVEENFKNGFRLSSNKNYVDILTYTGNVKANSFVHLMKDFVKSKIERPKVEDEKIIIHTPVKKN